MEEDMKMDFVYDYMYHLLKEYAKLLRFKPRKPEGAVEMCAENWTPPAWYDPNVKKFMLDSMVKSPSKTSPCNMPPPYNGSDLGAVLDRRDKILKKVKMWEDEYWKNQRKKA